MRNLLWLVPVAVFFLNPNLACSDEPQYQYGAAEMRAAVEGDWTLTLALESGEVPVTVHVEQALTAPTASARPAPGLLRAAHACGTRTLIKGAGACTDQTEMPLTVTYLSGNAAFTGVPMSGTFRVGGLVFARGDLSLTIGAYQLQMGVNADGSLIDPRVVCPAGLTVAITR
jgi:hypothetical protein